MAQGSAGTGEDVVVNFGANISNVQQSLSELGRSIGGLTGVFSGLQSAFLTFTGILAGGSAFRSAINNTNEMVDSTRRLMNMTGMNAREAQSWADILGRVGSSGDAFASTLMRMQMRLNTNEQAFRQYGIATRDAATGGLLPAEQVMRNTLTTLEGLKAGTDRNQASIQLLGRGARDIEPFMRAMKESVEENAQGMERLGLIITDNEIKLRDDYRKALDDVNDVMDAVQKKMAMGLMPVLIQMSAAFASVGEDIVTGAGEGMQFFLELLGEITDGIKALWDIVSTGFAEIGKAINSVFGRGSETMSGLEFFRNVLTVLRVSVVGFRTAIQVAFEFIRGQIEGTVGVIMRFANVFEAILNSKWSDIGKNAAAAWKEGSAQIEAAMAASMARAVKIAEGAKQEIADIISGPDPTNYGNEGRNYQGGAKVGGGSGSAQEDSRRASAMLLANLALQRAEREKDFASEKEYNRQSLASLEDLYQNKAISIESYYDAKRELMLADLEVERKMKEGQKADVEKQLKSGKGTLREEEQLRLKAQIVALDGELLALDAKRKGIAVEISTAEGRSAQALADRLSAMEAAHTESRVTGAIEAERAAADAQIAQGHMTQQEIADLERDWEARRYAAQMDRLAEAQSRLRSWDLEAIKAHNKEKEDAEAEHNARMADIDTKFILRASEDRMRTFQQFEQSFKGMVSSVLTGVSTIQDAFKNMLKSIGLMFADLISKRLFERLLGEGTAGRKAMDKALDMVVEMIDRTVALFLGGEVMKTTITEAGAEARETVTEKSIIKTLAIEAWGAMKSIGISIAEAFAKFVAALGFLGPYAVPAAAALSAVAMVGAYSMLNSAEGGWWQVPGDQIAKIHENEMVLPAAEAQSLRELLAGAGGAGGETHLHVHAVDAQSVERLFRNNGQALVSVLKSQHRNFATKT